MNEINKYIDFKGDFAKAILLREFLNAFLTPYLIPVFWQNECSFVSLRDVERTLKVMCWFYEQGERTDLFHTIREKVGDSLSDEDSYETEEEEDSPQMVL